MPDPDPLPRRRLTTGVRHCLIRGGLAAKGDVAARMRRCQTPLRPAQSPNNASASPSLRMAPATGS